MKKITILGSTGSIGKNTLNVLQEHPHEFEVFALAAKSSVDELFLQCLKFKPRFAVMFDPVAAKRLRSLLSEQLCKTEVLSGVEGICDVASHPETDMVVAAIVGGVGLLPTFAAVKKGKRVLLANKEALVMSGSLTMSAALQSGATLLPVDSEHNAIFQCMPSNYRPGDFPEGVRRIILTASGGPFRTLSLSEFPTITPEAAVAHPNWRMGAKISVDSATMMNKGLEVIEAFWLFQMPIDKINVMLHPQSIIHSFVEYEDGSLLAQLGVPDMRIPIANTLAWPKRIRSGADYLDLVKIGQLNFEDVDLMRFPSLKLAYEALRIGKSATTILNASNEIAVAAFLNRGISFLQIHEVVQETLSQMPITILDSIEAVIECDLRAREKTQYICENLATNTI